MQEPVVDRYAQDKAIVISIVKYVLITALVLAALYAGIKLFWILIPFLIGFVLARASSGLSTGILLLIRRLRKGRYADKVPADTDDEDDAEEEVGDEESRPLVSPLFVRGQRKPAARRRKRSAGTVLGIVFFILLLLCLVGLIILIAVVGGAQIKNLVDKLPSLFSGQNIRDLLEPIQNLSERLGGALPASVITTIEEELYSFQQFALKQIPVIATTLLNFVLGMFSGLPVFFFMVIVVIVSGFYFLTEKRAVRAFMKRNVPSESFLMNAVQLINSLFSTLFRTIGGYFLLLVITYLLALISLLIIDMPYAVVLALVAAILDFLPVLGLGVTFVPVAVYMAVTGNVYGAVGAIVALAAMTVLRRFIEPTILGSALRMHPMATLFSMLVGVSLFGLAGFLFGPILMVVLSETLTQFQFDRKLRVWFGHLLDRVADNGNG
ncbi:MAG: AI-2E family transporter [Clostridiaceae bacterium]|nr:AI-2E family transporter [Clostridiaceae bacterium]